MLCTSWSRVQCFLLPFGGNSYTCDTICTGVLYACTRSLRVFHGCVAEAKLSVNLYTKNNLCRMYQPEDVDAPDEGTLNCGAEWPDFENPDVARYRCFYQVHEIHTKYTSIKHCPIVNWKYILIMVTYMCGLTKDSQSALELSVTSFQDLHSLAC